MAKKEKENRIVENGDARNERWSNTSRVYQSEKNEQKK